MTHVKSNFESVLRHLWHIGVGLAMSRSRIASMLEVLSLGLLWRGNTVPLLNSWRHSQLKSGRSSSGLNKLTGLFMKTSRYA